MNATYELINGWERALESPETFGIPIFEEVEGLKEGDIVKLVFSISYIDEDGEAINKVERMWVEITTGEFPFYEGVLANDAFCTDELYLGLELKFEAQNIIDIYES